jgi:hypothetical protein
MECKIDNDWWKLTNAENLLISNENIWMKLKIGNITKYVQKWKTKNKSWNYVVSDSSPDVCLGRAMFFPFTDSAGSFMLILKIANASWLLLMFWSWSLLLFLFRLLFPLWSFSITFYWTINCRAWIISILISIDTCRHVGKTGWLETVTPGAQICLMRAWIIFWAVTFRSRRSGERR